MAINSAFTPYGNAYRLDLTTSSASVQIPTVAGQTPQTIYVSNQGAQAISFVVAYGASAPTAVAPAVGAPAAGIFLGATDDKVFTLGLNPALGPNLYLAAISSSGASTIYFQFGDGR